MKKIPLSIISAVIIVGVVSISFVACSPNKEVVKKEPDKKQGNFNGKLVDQGLEAVVDAEVTANISAPNSTSNRPPQVVKTDADGVFQLNLLPGEKVELTPHKKGYALADTNTTIQLDSSPINKFSADQPAIIKMRKLQGVEPLSSFTGTSQFQNAGVPVYYDFVTKSFSADSGDIKITVKRPDGAIASADHPDWGLQLETTPDVGLIEITPEIWRTTAWAPVNGYEPKRELLVSGKGSTPWSTNAQRYYLVQSRQGGVYTKLALNVKINLDPKTPYEVSVAGVANTNGSCNWEADIGSPVPAPQ